MREIYEKIRKEDIENAKELLREIYEKDGMKIPDWLKK